MAAPAGRKSSAWENWGEGRWRRKGDTEGAERRQGESTIRQRPWSPMPALWPSRCSSRQLPRKLLPMWHAGPCSAFSRLVHLQERKVPRLQQNWTPRAHVHNGGESTASSVQMLRVQRSQEGRLPPKALPLPQVQEARPLGSTLLVSRASTTASRHLGRSILEGAQHGAVTSAPGG